MFFSQSPTFSTAKVEECHAGQVPAVAGVVGEAPHTVGGVNSEKEW